MRSKSENIENIFSKILREEIYKKSKLMSEKFGEWVEIDTNEELHGKQHKLDVAKPKGKLTKADFDALRRRKHKKDVDESETEEGNEFTGELNKARKRGDDTFEVDGKKYPVKEEKKWIQKTDMKKGALHKKLGIPEDENIPISKLKSIKKDLMKKSEGDKKLSYSDSKLLKQVNLALTLKDIKESNSLKLTESELIDLIEDLVKNQINEVTDLDNMNTKSPEGLKKTKKVQDQSKKENEDYAKEVVKKMKEYLKDGSNGDYDENPDFFPKNNGELGEMKKRAYQPSKAVEEYIEAFAYPGLENLHYDEIKPNDEWLESNIKGSSKTGNNPKWANAVETDLGEKINKKRKENLYDKEKRRSYKRVTQPVDEAGDGDGEDKLDNMFAKLESVEDKKNNKVISEIVKMKNLFKYNEKTQ